MILYGVIREMQGSSNPFVFAICDTEERANNLVRVESAKTNHKDDLFWVHKINDNAKIGDDLSSAKILPREPIDHYSVLIGQKGFHGKYDHKTGKNKPTERSGDYRYTPIVLGWIVRKSMGELKGNVSYSRIDQDNEINDPDNYEIKHKVIINKDYSVSLNDRLIASAPTKKTRAFKERFCKAIIWSLMNDQDCLRDKLKEISGIIADDKPILFETIPEKIKNLLPIFPAGFIPWLNLTITEERCST